MYVFGKWEREEGRLVIQAAMGAPLGGVMSEGKTDFC